MMKKRVTAGLLALTLALSGGGLSVGVFEGLQTDIQASAETYGDYEYIVTEYEGVKITKYNGSSATIIIPKTINGNNVTSIGECAFYGSTITNIVIPNTVTIIEYRAFYKCRNLKVVKIPDSITSISSEVFYGCSSLNGITIPDGTTAIGSGAFYGCTSLSNITIPDNVTSIGSNAFTGCKLFKSITIPKSVTNIGEDAFCVRTSYKTDGFIIKCYTHSVAEEYAIANSIGYELVDGVNPAIPNTTVTAYNGAVLLDWEEIPDSEMYLVRYKKVSDSTFNEILVFENTVTAINGLANGNQYVFVVLSYVDDRWSSYTDSDFIKATPNASSSEKNTLVNFNTTPGDEKVTVTWNKIPGAEKYRVVYKAPSISNEYKEITVNDTETSLTVDGLTNDTLYYFVVSAYSNGKWSAYNGYDFDKVTPTAEVVHEHEYIGVVTTEPTCTEDGVMTYACECGETYTEVIPATGHTYTVTTVAPTETEEGYDLHICDKCGDSYKDKIVPPKPIIRYPVVSYEVSGNQFRLKWTAAAGAEKYGIAVYQSGGWRVKAQMNGNITTFTSPKMKPGSYKMVICAKVNGIWDTGSINSRAFTITI